MTKSQDNRGLKEHNGKLIQMWCENGECDRKAMTKHLGFYVCRRCYEQHKKHNKGKDLGIYGE